MRTLKTGAMIALLVSILASIGSGDVPSTMTVQGRLTGATGEPIADSSVELYFKIYDEISAGIRVWPFSSVGELHAVTTDANGLWAVLLGTTYPIVDSNFADTSLWLEVTVNDGASPEVLPRVKLNTGPFAFRAAWAQKADTALAVVDDGGIYLPLAGGTMTGPIINTGNPPITMGSGNFGSGNTNTGTNAFVAGQSNDATGGQSAVGGGFANDATSFAATVAGGSGNTASGESSFIGGGVGNLAAGDRSVVGGGILDSAFGSSAVIAGGSGNKTTAAGATIGGGTDNVAANGFATISGGRLNVVNGFSSTTGGGEYNIATNYASTIGGGAHNVTLDSGATIGGGIYNYASGAYSTIAGGGGASETDSNSASGLAAVIGGGTGNTASGVFATISGGFLNTARGTAATVGGGTQNSADSTWSTIAGGNGNVSNGFWTSITGGVVNYAGDTAATVAGGYRDSAATPYSTVAGGRDNAATGYGATISGGRDNQARDEFSTVGGGRLNSAAGALATVPGGLNNSAGGDSATVGGGANNSADFLAATVNGGHRNIAGGIASTVGGGSMNAASGHGSTVGGGESNVASGVVSSVGGGRQNEATENFATVGGGGLNMASGERSTVGGGFENLASNDYTTVAGGYRNAAGNGFYATVGGGIADTASGAAATVPGGSHNHAAGNFSFAAGNNAKAMHQGTFVWSDSRTTDFVSTGMDQFLIRAKAVGIGTNDPDQFLHVLRGSAGAVDAHVNSIGIFESDVSGYFSILTPDNSERGILFGEPASQVAGGIIYNNPSTPDGLQFRTAGNQDRLAISAAGDVGIATNSPAAQLHVVSTDTAAGLFTSNLGNHNTKVVNAQYAGVGLWNATAIYGSSRPSDGWGIGGQFIGGGDAVQALVTPTGNQIYRGVYSSVNGGTGTNYGIWAEAIGSGINYAGWFAGNVNATGTVCASNIACPSDERLKENIRPVHGAMEAIKKLQPVNYEWSQSAKVERSLPEGKQLGLIAQDVERIVPQAAVTMPDGYLAVDYARLVPLLIEAVKEQQSEIERLRQIVEQNRE